MLPYGDDWIYMTANQQEVDAAEFFDSLPSAQKLSNKQRKVALRAHLANYDVTTVVRRATTFVSLKVPNSSVEPKEIWIANSWADDFDSVDFANYIQLGNFNAVLEKSSNTIFVGMSGDTVLLARALAGTDDLSIPDQSFPIRVGSGALDDPAGPFGLTLHTGRTILNALTRGTLFGDNACLAIEIPFGNFELSFAERIAAQVGGAFCFDLDCRTGLRLGISRTAGRVESPDRAALAETLDLKAPRNTYDGSALELYLEARDVASATNQFLLHYQVLEYFFERAAQADTRDSIERVLRDPRYDYGSAEQIRAIAGQVRVMRGDSTNEREQLRVLLGQVVDQSQLVQFATSIDSFSSDMSARKQRLYGVTAIRFDHENSDLINEVSVRVYAIRNRIVHAKQSESYKQAPPLWATSAESEYLSSDLALMRFLSQRALIRYSEAFL